MSATNQLFAFEDQGAREWDSDSFISAEYSTEDNLIEVTGDKNHDTLVNVSSTEVSSTSPSLLSTTSISRRKIGRYKLGLSHAATERIKSANGSRPTNTESSGPSQTKRKLLTSATGPRWAKAEGLVTNRLATHRHLVATEKAERQKYLDPPMEQEEFPAWACYIWPYWNESATTLLGARLEDLNAVRLNNRVWIEWDEGSKCINIHSRSVSNADMALNNAIIGIRDAVKHAKAARVTANPLHIVHPPTTSAMRRLIKPSNVEASPPKAEKLKLEGPLLSDSERLEWETIRKNRLLLNNHLLEEHLTKNLLVYAPVKFWMRMRVHFGNIIMNKFTTEFKETGSSWSAFGEMVGTPRFSATINRNLGDSRLALILRNKIIQDDDTFCSVHGRTNLKDIQFKDAEIIHFEIRNQQFRMEGEMDRSFDNPDQAYQMGSNALYKDNRRNVLVETRTIDIESGLDWKLELIADNKDQVLNLPLELRTVIEDSVPTKTQLRTDALGLQFPDVTPKPSHSIFISSIWIRSAIKFRMKESGYILEIVIYRKWAATTTQGDPEMFCSVSMFHPDWDDETQDVSTKSSGRNWNDDLSNFFKKNDDCKTGFEYFLSQVRRVQGYILQAREDLIKLDTEMIDLLG